MIAGRVSSGTRRVPEEPFDALLRRPHRAASGDGKPDDRCPDRPQRPGRPAFRPVPAMPRIARQTPVQAERRHSSANCSRWPPAAWSSPRSRSSCPTRRARRCRTLSERRNIVVIADEAHRSQYDLIDGLARNTAGCAAQRLVHRLHRHAHRENRRQHAGRVRRLHLDLRHPACRRRQGDGADLLRKPHRQAGAQ